MFWMDDLKPPNHPNGEYNNFICTYTLVTIACDFTVATHLQVLEKAQKTNLYNEREAAYIRAAESYASGDLIGCNDELMAILRDYPLGMSSAVCKGYEVEVTFLVKKKRKGEVAPTRLKPTQYQV